MDRADHTTRKTTLRGGALARRKALPDDVRKTASATIAERAGSLVVAMRPAGVASYLPIGSECDPRSLNAEIEAMGAQLGLPAVVDGGGLVFRRYAPGDRLVAGAHRTREPLPDAPLLLPDLIVVPVVGFDRLGMRLGYGRGYYDSAISALRDAGGQPRLLGIAFSVQEVETIPAEPHDVRLDYVVTEKETLEFRTS